jgi:hypothetical protein
LDPVSGQFRHAPTRAHCASTKWPQGR